MVGVSASTKRSSKIETLLHVSDIIGRIFVACSEASMRGNVSIVKIVNILLNINVVISIVALSLTVTLLTYMVQPWRGLGHAVDLSVILLIASLPLLLYVVLGCVLILGCKQKNTTLILFWLTLETTIIALQLLQLVGFWIICIQEGTIIVSLIISIVPMTQIFAIVVVTLLYLELKKTERQDIPRNNLEKYDVIDMTSTPAIAFERMKQIVH